MSAGTDRDKALSILNANFKALSKLYKECFLAMGRGALLIYAEDVMNGRMPGKESYRRREEMLEIFDSPDSQAQLARMIDSYEPKKEGIMTLITTDANATFFVTCKL
jgi:hypothetical protein